MAYYGMNLPLCGSGLCLALIVTGFLAVSAPAADTVDHGSQNGSHSSFVEVARRVQPTVVSLSVSRTQAHKYAQSRVRQSLGPVRHGSGVILDTGGHILTNHHVVDGAVGIQVSLSDGTLYSAEIIGQDPATDLALVRLVPDGPIDTVRVSHLGDSDSVLVGDWVLAFGSPFGFRHTVSVGVISAKGRHLDTIGSGGPLYQDFLQTDASINPGNSGGPLIDVRGHVVGINTAYNPGGSGIGFAIPINLAAKVVSELREHGEVVRGYLGIHPQDLTSDIAEATGLEPFQGVLVGQVQSGSPAEVAGLQRGDVIQSLAGQPLSRVADYLTLVADRQPAGPVELSVLREGVRTTVSAVLGRRPTVGDSRIPAPSDLSGGGWAGIEVADRWGLEARRLGIPKTARGVVVTHVVPGGPAEQKGILRGDVILEVDGVSVVASRDYHEVITGARDRTKPVLFVVLKRLPGRSQFVALRPPLRN